MVNPQMLATMRAPLASRAGRSCSIQASTPGFWRPTLLSIPAAVSWSRGGGGGETRHLVHIGGRADVRAVGPWAAAPRRVDNKVDLAAGEQFDGVGADGFTELDDRALHWDTAPLEEQRRARSGHDREAELDEAPGSNRPVGLVAIGQREEHRAAVGQAVAGCHLALG